MDHSYSSIVRYLFCFSLFIVVLSPLISAKEILPGIKLKIVTKNGVEHIGKYETANDHAISIQLRTGKYILIDRDDIASSYRRKSYAQEGFVAGSVLGILVTLTPEYTDRSKKNFGINLGINSILLGALGYAAGSAIHSDQPIDLNDLYIAMRKGGNNSENSQTIYFGFNFSF
ncbi:MAG: hypothetical protein V3V99_14380 [candidate division Zixibacteria bacterium]